MTTKFLKKSEVSVIANDIDSIFSENESSGNKIENLAVTDAIAHNDSDYEKIVTVNQIFT